ncbi:MAG: UDP-N-acetylglucosamine--N-acetylmuramyl-(pentapeptide) pyrophosphoryl-undecaprenol N-acetylglucosamine transferase [Planctomycetes bacterium]|nr:UDP-N-acetylglucosamine--N-acetylmuramyl-(pentapeptide) pyrophosphoryl-undecaprenol N-acetylglucosamine transferase [Planctomycetota bacterium]
MKAHHPIAGTVHGHRGSRGTHVVFAGGGTGGHLFPGLAVAEALRQAQPELRITFVGSGRSLERGEVPAAGFDYMAIAAAPGPRKMWHWPRFASSHIAASLTARRWLEREQASLVVGLGGYASVPAVAAAQRMNLPTLLLEQNAVPGRATRWLAGRASVVCLALSQSQSWLGSAGNKAVVTGNPLRRPFRVTSRRADADRVQKTCVVLGGSGGAVELNTAFLDALTQLRGVALGWRMVHQTGTTEAEAVARRYALMGCDAHVTPFIDHPAEVLAEADLVVTRAGATSLAELAALGVPTVACPYPRAVDQHQWHNAQVYAEAGGCHLVDFRTGEPGATLAKTLAPLLVDRVAREALGQAMRRLAVPDAAERVAMIVSEMIGYSTLMRQAA